MSKPTSTFPLPRWSRGLLVAMLVFAPRWAHADWVVVPPDAPPPTAFVGLPVGRIAIEVADSPWDVPTPDLKAIPQGKPFHPSDARALMKEALDTGNFAQAKVLAQVESGSLVLTIALEPRKIARNVTADIDLPGVDRDEFLRESALVSGSEVTNDSLETSQDRLEAYLHRRGYTAARVGFVTRPMENPADITIRVEVTPGPVTRIGARQIFLFGAKRETLGDLLETYEVRRGDPLSQVAMTAANERLETALQKKGYHTARVSHDIVKQNDAILLRVRVDSGPLVQLRFEGNDHFDRDTLVATMALQENSERNPTRMAQALEDFYRKRGFLDVSVRTDTLDEPGKLLRTHQFFLREGEQVQVVERTYPCLDTQAIAGLSEGGPSTLKDLASEVDSFLEEDLPGNDLLRSPDVTGLDSTVGGDGHRPAVNPTQFSPRQTYFHDSYDRAIQHVRDLYRSEGFLHAEVGPMSVLRRRCDPHSPPKVCNPMPLGAAKRRVCSFDSSGLPVPMAPMDADTECRPDPTRGITCDRFVSLEIPVQLGPRTYLYDMDFRGAQSISETSLAKAAGVTLGQPVNTNKLEEASRNLLNLYRNEGYANAVVRYSLDPSADHSRARVRFEITEGDLIKVRNIFVEGNHLTRADVILGRSALKRGQPYRLSDVRATQEYVATLGVFESVSVELENPYYPETEKNVILRVVERLPQYVEFRPGVASGEGLRLTTEYGHRNFQGRAIGLSGRVQFAVLPDFLIYDPKVRENFEEITNTYERVTVRGTITASLPDIGLGPRVRASVDLVGVQDLQRGFLLKKLAAIPTLFYRPTQPLQISLSQSVEYNYIRVLGSAEEKADLENQIRTDPALGRILRIPNDGSIASAQRLTVAVDTRDNAFSAHRGLYIAAGVEHVDSYPYASQYADPDDLFEGHFFRLTETISSYVTLPFRWVLAGTIRAGQNVHIFSRSRSRTYPDRSFFLGGADSVRGFQQDHLVPQDVSDSLERQEDPGIRGGDLMVNPRVELRIPLRGALETVLFFDSGNVWADPFSIKRGTDLLHLRTSAGTGLRWNSPVGLPFAFDLGFNLLPRPYEARGDTVVSQVHFQLGLF